MFGAEFGHRSHADQCEGDLDLGPFGTAMAGLPASEVDGALAMLTWVQVIGSPSAHR